MTEQAKQSNKLIPGVKLKGKDKTDKIPVKIVPTKMLKKPSWIRVKLQNNDIANQVHGMLDELKLNTVCKEAACPNIHECYAKGTATFMILGAICTRRCPFCDVGFGRPNPVDPEEATRLAKAVERLKLKYVVITSVDRDDLRDGGAKHFADCIREVRALSPNIKIEVLTPDFRKREEVAINILEQEPPDVFNHNLETVPRLYRQSRPGASYLGSLQLLADFKKKRPDVPTKSGIMVGLGETDEEIIEVMKDMRQYNIDMITIGQYLQPSKHHLPVTRYVTPDQFKQFEKIGYELGFINVASGAMVRSSYHADLQAENHV